MLNVELIKKSIIYHSEFNIQHLVKHYGIQFATLYMFKLTTIGRRLKI